MPGRKSEDDRPAQLGEAVYQNRHDGHAERPQRHPNVMACRRVKNLTPARKTGFRISSAISSGIGIGLLRNFRSDLTLEQVKCIPLQ